MEKKYLHQGYLMDCVKHKNAEVRQRIVLPSEIYAEIYI